MVGCRWHERPADRGAVLNWRPPPLDLRRFLARPDVTPCNLTHDRCPYDDALCLPWEPCPMCLLDELLGVPAEPIARRIDVRREG